MFVYRYSLSVAPGMQEFYESYFKVAYPLPKQDLAVIEKFHSFCSYIINHQLFFFFFWKNKILGDSRLFSRYDCRLSLYQRFYYQSTYSNVFTFNILFVFLYLCIGAMENWGLITYRWVITLYVSYVKMCSIYINSYYKYLMQWQIEHYVTGKAPYWLMSPVKAEAESKA